MERGNLLVGLSSNLTTVISLYLIFIDLLSVIPGGEKYLILTDLFEIFDISPIVKEGLF